MVTLRRAVIVHGTRSAPERSWFPWLTWQLLRHQVQVVVPRLPTPRDQSLTSWTSAFAAQVAPVDESTLLIGQSTGCPFLLHLLAGPGPAVAGTVLVAAFSRPLAIEEGRALIASFVAGPFDWAAIRRRAGRPVCFHGDDDPVVPLACGREVAGALGAPLEVVRGGGHLNTAAGFLEFPALLAWIRGQFALPGVPAASEPAAGTPG
jgi:hypothetical protein